MIYIYICWYIYAQNHHTRMGILTLHRIILEVGNYESFLAIYQMFYRSEDILRETTQLPEKLTGFYVKIYKHSFNRSINSNSV